MPAPESSWRRANKATPMSTSLNAMLCVRPDKLDATRSRTNPSTRSPTVVPDGICKNAFCGEPFCYGCVLLSIEDHIYQNQTYKQQRKSHEEHVADPLDPIGKHDQCGRG